LCSTGHGMYIILEMSILKAQRNNNRKLQNLQLALYRYACKNLVENLIRGIQIIALGSLREIL